MALRGACQLKLIFRLNSFQSGLKCTQLHRLSSTLTPSDFTGTTTPKCLSTSAQLLCKEPKSQLTSFSLNSQRIFSSSSFNFNRNSMAGMIDPDGQICSKRTLSTAAPNKDETKDKVKEEGTAGHVPENVVAAPLSTKEKFKKAVKDYGATVIVFHVMISLTSLGISYALVSSGLDVVAFLEWMGVGKAILESKITQGASTFVVAYAFHKVFAPVRITITLTATPLIVRYLRGIGILKKPVA